MPFSLLELPAELRTMILAHFWNVSIEDAIEQESTWDRSINVFVDCRPKALQPKSSESIRPKVPQHALPAWLFLSRSIFSEALDVIARNSRVHIGSIISGSDVDKYEAEATALLYGACKIGSHEYVVSADNDNQSHNCDEWYAHSGLPGILAPCTPRRLVAEFPPTKSSLISPLYPWMDEEIALCRSVFWAYCKTNNIKEWKLIVNCGVLFVHGARHGLDRVEMCFVRGKDDKMYEEHLPKVEGALWKELNDLNERGLRGFESGLKDGVKVARVYAGNWPCGWNIVWTRVVEQDGI